jgi:hypothetical protein
VFVFTPLLQTLLNQLGYPAASLVPAYAVLLVSAAIAFHMAGGSLSRLKSCILCGNAETVEVPADGAEE